MGRIKSKWMKTVAARLQEAYPDRFNKDFENNKQVMKETGLFKEKKNRNKIAGFIARSQQKVKL